MLDFKTKKAKTTKNTRGGNGKKGKKGKSPQQQKGGKPKKQSPKGKRQKRNSDMLPDDEDDEFVGIEALMGLAESALLLEQDGTTATPKQEPSLPPRPGRGNLNSNPLPPDDVRQSGLNLFFFPRSNTTYPNSLFGFLGWVKGTENKSNLPKLIPFATHDGILPPSPNSPLGNIAGTVRNIPPPPPHCYSCLTSCS